MRILLVRSIPLSRKVRNAWKANGGVFLRRVRNGQVSEVVADRYDRLVNLGNTNLSVDGSILIYNDIHTIRAISTPLALRRTLEDTDLIPVATYAGTHWHKGKGYGGDGKIFHERNCSDRHIIASDLQQHIEGNEYRVITVGDTVVQASLKHRTEQFGIPVFDYEWVGVEGVRKNGIIPHIKEVVERIPGGERSVLGFDIIHDGSRPWTIEINTSPGVNEYTARRIVNALESSS